MLANVVAYVSGSLLHLVDIWLREALSLPGAVQGHFPVLAFAIHGAWMLWVTAPAAITDA